MNKKVYFIMIIISLIFSLQTIMASEVNVESENTLDKIYNFIDDIKIKVRLNNEYKDIYSYQELVEYINKHSEEDGKKNYILNLHPGDYNITEVIECGNVKHKPQFNINGNGITIDGHNEKQFMNLYSDCNINNLTVINTKYGFYNSSGVIAMQNASNLNLNNCVFKNNHGKIKGCVITNRGKCEITNCTFINNTSEKTGGAIWSTGEYGGQLIIRNSTFKENIANYKVDHERTSIIYLVSYGANIIENNVFINNTGRCIHSYLNTSSVIRNNTFTGNNLTFSDVIRGGVIDNYESDLIVENNVFNDVTLGELRGGIIYHEIGYLQFNNNTVNHIHQQEDPITNENCSKGGVLFNRNATIDVKDNYFNNTVNSNLVRGGVIYNNLGNITLEGNTYNNTINGNKTKGVNIFNDVNGKIFTSNEHIDSTINGTFEISDEDKYIYNSNVPNTEGKGVKGLTYYN